jgi:uncharacterized protein YkwD
MRLILAALCVVLCSQVANAENRLIRTECSNGQCRRVYVGSQWEYEVVDKVNHERRIRGLNPLRVTQNLMDSARRWSGRQAEQRKMYHSNWGIAENVAYGQQGPSDVMRAWLNSPGHRANILNPGYSEIGVGIVMSSGGQPYYTQHFR